MTRERWPPGYLRRRQSKKRSKGSWVILDAVGLLAVSSLGNTILIWWIVSHGSRKDGHSFCSRRTVGQISWLCLPLKAKNWRLQGILRTYIKRVSRVGGKFWLVRMRNACSLTRLAQKLGDHKSRAMNLGPGLAGLCHRYVTTFWIFFWFFLSFFFLGMRFCSDFQSEFVVFKVYLINKKWCTFLQIKLVLLYDLYFSSAEDTVSKSSLESITPGVAK